MTNKKVIKIIDELCNVLITIYCDKISKHTNDPHYIDYENLEEFEIIIPIGIIRNITTSTYEYDNSNDRYNIIYINLNNRVDIDVILYNIDDVYTYKDIIVEALKSHIKCICSKNIIEFK